MNLKVKKYIVMSLTNNFQELKNKHNIFCCLDYKINELLFCAFFKKLLLIFYKKFYVAIT